MTCSTQIPCTRRRFLTMSAGAFVFRPHCLQSAEKELPPFSFVVVSDTHLGYRDQDSAARQWAQVAAAVEKSEGELVLHLGDVVDGGREAQYPVYLETRKTIRKPVYEIPGNHDPVELFEDYLGGPTDRVVDCRWLRFILMNNARFGSHDGFLTDNQIAWIDRQCDEAAGRELFVVLAMHVPAHSNRHPDRGWYVKPEYGQTKLYELLSKHASRVLMLLHGHFHNGIRGWDDHTPLQEIAFPSTLYNQDRRLEEQTAPGFNVSEFRPGFTRVSIRDSAVHLSYQLIQDNEAAHRQCPLPQLRPAW